MSVAIAERQKTGSQEPFVHWDDAERVETLKSLLIYWTNPSSKSIKIQARYGGWQLNEGGLRLYEANLIQRANGFISNTLAGVLLASHLPEVVNVPGITYNLDVTRPASAYIPVICEDRKQNPDLYQRIREDISSHRQEMTTAGNPPTEFATQHWEQLTELEQDLMAPLIEALLLVRAHQESQSEYWQRRSSLIIPVLETLAREFWTKGDGLASRKNI